MVKISYAYNKNICFLERERKIKMPISRILLFHSKIGTNYKHYNKYCKHSQAILVPLTPQQIISINSRPFRKEQELNM